MIAFDLGQGSSSLCPKRPIIRSTAQAIVTALIGPLLSAYWGRLARRCVFSLWNFLSPQQYWNWSLELWPLFIHLAYILLCLPEAIGLLCKLRLALLKGFYSIIIPSPSQLITITIFPVCSIQMSKRFGKTGGGEAGLASSSQSTCQAANWRQVRTQLYCLHCWRSLSYTLLNIICRRVRCTEILTKLVEALLKSRRLEWAQFFQGHIFTLLCIQTMASTYQWSQFTTLFKWQKAVSRE